MTTTQIAVIVGSFRRDSFNGQLAVALERLAPPTLSLKRLSIDALPPYDPNDDAEPGEAVRQLRAELAASQGLLFVTPEHSRSMPDALKNALDHGAGPKGRNAWAGKPAGIIGVSLGAPRQAVAPQPLRHLLADLDVPTLGQPEPLVQASVNLCDDDGQIGAGGQAAMQLWMNQYADFVRQHTV